MSWRRGNKESGDVRSVVGEAERLLMGRTLESYVARRQRVPAWSLIGLLAHGTRLDLMRLASPVNSPDPAGWSGTVARLARDLLALSYDDPSLIQVQRRSVVPLELDLLGGTIPPPTSPAQLYSLVYEAFERRLSPDF